MSNYKKKDAIWSIDYDMHEDKCYERPSCPECHAPVGKIEMRKGQHPDYYNQTLIHEVVHGMLMMIGRNDLSNDETFVQSMALAISQTFDLKEEEND